MSDRIPKSYREIRGSDYVMTVKASGSEEENVLNFIGSSEAKDRQGDIVKSNGWRLEHYKTNPVFLWGHDHGGLPIGKTLEVKVNKKEKRLEFKVQFAVDEYPFARTVYNLYKKGFLNATSVGFMVNDWEYDEDEDAYLLTDNELLELSGVTVPANPEALRLGVSKGLFDAEDVTQMKELGMLTPPTGDPVIVLKTLDNIVIKKIDEPKVVELTEEQKELELEDIKEALYTEEDDIEDDNEYITLIEEEKKAASLKVKVQLDEEFKKELETFGLSLSEVKDLITGLVTRIDELELQLKNTNAEITANVDKDKQKEEAIALAKKKALEEPQDKKLSWTQLAKAICSQETLEKK